MLRQARILVVAGLTLLSFGMAGRVLAGNLTQTAGGITFAQYPLPTANSFPSQITVGPDHAFYVGEQRGNRIARVTAQGVITEFPVPTPGAGIGGLTTGPDGDVWFVETNADQIARLSPAGQITEFATPTAHSHPIAIAAMGQNLWFTEGQAGKIGRSDTSGNIVEFPVVNPSHYPFGILAGLDGKIYYTYRLGGFGRLLPDGSSSEALLPDRPSAFTGNLARGPGNLGYTWMQGAPADTSNMVYQFDPSNFPASVQVSPLSKLALDASAKTVGGMSFTPDGLSEDIEMTFLDQNEIVDVRVRPGTILTAEELAKIPTHRTAIDSPNGIAADGKVLAVTQSDASKVAIGLLPAVKPLALPKSATKPLGDLAFSVDSFLASLHGGSNAQHVKQAFNEGFYKIILLDFSTERKATGDLLKAVDGSVLPDPSFTLPVVGGSAALPQNIVASFLTQDATFRSGLKTYTRTVFQFNSDAKAVVTAISRSQAAAAAGDTLSIESRNADAQKFSSAAAADLERVKKRRLMAVSLIRSKFSSQYARHVEGQLVSKSLSSREAAVSKELTGLVTGP